jgi:hypothetical protein
MAGIDFNEAKRLALQIKASGQAPGVPLQQLIKNIMLPPGPGQQVEPAPALGGVFKPVPVGAMQAMEQPVKVVTPAAPAPLQPGVEIKAPAAPQQYESPYTVRARRASEQLAAMAPPAENASIDQRGAYEQARRKAAIAQEEADAVADAKIRPEEEEIFAGREAKVGEKLAALEKDRKSSKWKALAEAGFKMAQSNSPYFMQALASGMEAGLKGYNARKTDMDEKQSLLKEQTENVKLARIRAIDAAQAQMLDAYRNGDKSALARTQMLATMREDIISGDTAASRVRTAELAPVALQADITQKEASADRDRAAADLARRTDPNIRSTGGGEPTLGGKGAPSVLSSLARQETAQAKIAADRFADPAQRAIAAAELKNIRRQIAWLKATMGLGGAAPTSPSGGFAPKATMQYVPGKGVVPAK